MTYDLQVDITNHLHCAAEHLNATIQMTESGQTCSEILKQLPTVRTALRAAGAGIIERQAQFSQQVILNSASVSERTATLHELQSLYALFC